MKRVIGVITARMTSERLPGKPLLDLSGKTVFAHHVERMKQVSGLSEIYLATSINPLNADLIEAAKKEAVKYHSGAEEDVVSRHIDICDKENADAVIRVTCDMPLFHIDAASQYISMFNKNECDFVCAANMTPVTGIVPELISHDALMKVHQEYRGTAVSQPIWQNLSRYATCSVEYHEDLVRPEYRLTLDAKEDYSLLSNIYDELYSGQPISLYAVYKYLDDNPSVSQINSRIKPKDVSVFSANLREAPVYSVVDSGSGYVILDRHKRKIDYSTFKKELVNLFE